MHQKYFHPLQNIYILEHGIHPPSGRGNPWELPELQDTEHTFVANNGVYEVYENEEDVKNKKPIEYAYPDLNTFVTDMNSMCNMIADGPL